MKMKWLLVSGMLISQCVIAKDLKLGVIGNFPPFDYLENGKPAGFNIDLAKRFCDVMKEKCQFVILKWDDLIPAVETGKIDAIATSMAIIPERQKRVLFSKRYMRVGGSFVAKKKKFLTTYVTAMDLSNKTVGVQGNTIYSNYMNGKYGSNKSIKIVEYPAVDEMYTDLQSGKIDILLDDLISAYDGHITQKKWSGMDLVGSPIIEPKYLGDGEGIAVNLKNPQLKQKFDQAIDAVIKDGSYREIMNKYFIFDLYGF